MQPGRRFLRGVTVGALGLVLVGFGVAVLDPSLPRTGSTPSGTGPATVSPPPTPSIRPSATGSLPTPEPTPSPSPTSSLPTPTASPSPTAKAGFLQDGDAIVYMGSDGHTIPVVAIPGLQVQVQSGRAVYLAMGGNKYGLKANAYAGEFVPLVTTGQPDGSSAQTGGAVLAGAVASKLLGDALARLPSGVNKVVVALPLDIRPVRNSDVEVSFDHFGLTALANTPRILVHFPGSVPLVETIPSNAGVHVLVEGVSLTSWQIIDPARLTLPPTKIDPAHAMNQLLIYGDGTPSVTANQSIDRHIGVGTQIMEVSGDVSISVVVEGSRADIGPGDVLQIAGVPVFVASASLPASSS